jgi:hypothetical protein
MENTEAIFQELIPAELSSVNGGGPITRLLSKISPWVALGTVLIYIYDNREEFVEGVKEGYASTQDK